MMRFMFEKLLICSVTLLMSVLCISAQAQDPRKIDDYGDWVAYVFSEGDNKVCYMVSQPTRQQGNYAKRGEVFALITHRPTDKSRNVFSYIAGYPYKTGSEVTVEVGNQRFVLFTQDESAWTHDQATDDELAAAIRRGSSIVVKGVSTKGTKTTDTFGLKGSSAAHMAITAACKN